MSFPTDQPVGGCLSLAWTEWQAIGSSPYIVSTLRTGYRLRFLTSPPLSEKAIPFSSYGENTPKRLALHEEVQKMKQKDAIEAVEDQRGFYSRLFVVPKPDGKFRPIIDLSSLNDYLLKESFEMETVASVLQAIRKNDWMISLDLKDAYFQIPIHPRSRKYLKFVWEGVIYQFKVLCFGLTSAPLIFTQVFAPVATFLRARGVRILRYLDDWLILESSKPRMLQARSKLLEICRRLNIVINWEKSSLEPSQTATYLGMLLDSRLSKAFPSKERLDRLSLILRRFSSSKAPPAELWQQVLGHLSSLTQVVPGGRLRMRRLQRQLKLCWVQATQYNQLPVPVNSKILSDIRWWTRRSNTLKGQPFGSPSPDLTAMSDASTQGWGMMLGSQTVKGLWSPQETKLHINVLELRAIRLGLQHFVNVVKGKVVVVLGDNTTALAYIKKGGGRSRCLFAARLWLY